MKPRAVSLATAKRVYRDRGYMSLALKRGIGLIYDRLGPKSPGAARLLVLLHKNQETARGRDRPQIIVCHPAERMAAARLPPPPDVCGTCARRRIYIILSGQWTERCRPESSPSPEYPHGDWRTRGNSASKPDDDRPRVKREKHENHVKPGRATIGKIEGTGDGGGGERGRGPMFRG